MQPTEQQVQRSLAALRDPDGALLVHPFETETVVPTDPDGPGRSIDEVPDGVLRRLDEAPSIRSERLEEARRRLADGEQPTAEDLAQRMVGRFVCDRLR